MGQPGGRAEVVTPRGGSNPAPGLTLPFSAVSLWTISRLIASPTVAAGRLALAACTATSLFVGAHATLAIGGADVPVVITCLNSASGWALCAEGLGLGVGLAP